MGWMLAVPAWGQLVSQPVDTGGLFGAPVVGQSFVAPATTSIGAIRVRSGSNVAGIDLLLYDGASGSGTADDVGTPSRVISGVSLTAASSGGPFSEVLISPPFPVVAGQSYTFVFDGSGPIVALYARSPGAYADGTIIRNYAIEVTGPDLAFEILEPSPSAGAVAAIPTLSPAGIVLAGLAIAAAAMVGWRRRFS